MNENLAIDIVKRDGKRPSEQFMPTKLRNSLIAACLSVQTPRGQAEAVADLVITSVTDWLAKKPEVTSDDLRRVATKNLRIHNPDAAYMYESYHHTI